MGELVELPWRTSCFGRIALLSDYFEGQLGNTEILQRLFSTANKSGIYSDSEIYGQGLMDLDAATSL